MIRKAAKRSKDPKWFRWQSWTKPNSTSKRKNMRIPVTHRFFLWWFRPLCKIMSLNGHLPQMGIRNLWNWGYAITSVNHQPWLPTNPWLRSCTTTTPMIHQDSWLTKIHGFIWMGSEDVAHEKWWILPTKKMLHLPFSTNTCCFLTLLGCDS